MTRPDYYGNPAGVKRELEIVRAIYDAFAARDIEAALPFVAPEAELHANATAAAAGRTGPYVGHDGMRTYFADVGRVWDELTLHADDFRVVPGYVVVMGHVTGRRGDAVLRRSVVWTWRVRDGQATYARVADMGELPPE